MPRRQKPLITLTSDFGLMDSYVAQMKAVLYREAPDARLVDVTHAIAPQDIVQASVVLEQALSAFEPGTVHLAVVDPGVGSSRRIIVTRVAGQVIVCPDNGLITWSMRRRGPGTVHELLWRPAASSRTFHGRDIMAPAAGRLAMGTLDAAHLKPIPDAVMLDIAPAVPPLHTGRIIHIDHFGNATTNVPEELLRGAAVKNVRVRGADLGSVKQTYADVRDGQLLALIGSSGLLEIAARNASAAEMLGLNSGDEVVIE